jgi:hypothetical protein
MRGGKLILAEWGNRVSWDGLRYVLSPPQSATHAKLTTCRGWTLVVGPHCFNIYAFQLVYWFLFRYTFFSEFSLLLGSTAYVSVLTADLPCYGPRWRFKPFTTVDALHDTIVRWLIISARDYSKRQHLEICTPLEQAACMIGSVLCTCRNKLYVDRACIDDNSTQQPSIWPRDFRVQRTTGL